MPFPKEAGAEKVTDADALPAVAVPIVGVSGRRPSPDVTIPLMLLIFHLLIIIPLI